MVTQTMSGQNKDEKFKKIVNTVLYSKKLPINLFFNMLSKYVLRYLTVYAGVGMCYPSTLV
jgi:hypothetical protein